MLDVAVRHDQNDEAEALQRTVGEARVAFRRRGDTTVLDDLYQAGAGKIRLPRHGAGPGPEAVLINTAGGLTGGDRLRFAVKAGTGAVATATTQASEKIYRSIGGVAAIEANLTLETGARLEWLPQDTIIFDGAALERRLSVDMAADASLLVLESVVFGRAAMGETVETGRFLESWRIRRGGELVFADETRLTGPIAETLRHSATAAGDRALATVLAVRTDAHDVVEPLRAVLPETAGASAFNGLLVARLTAPGSQALRRALEKALHVLRAGAPLPKVWTC